MNEICPVCKSHLNSIDCPVCGTQFAGADLFAGITSYKAWHQSMKEAKDNFVMMDREQLVDVLNVSRDCVAVHNKRKGVVTIFNSRGTIETVEDVTQVSIGETHRIFVLRDGKVKALGDNSFLQCNVSGLRNIKFAVASDRSTYLVDQSGKAMIVGSSNADLIKELANKSRIKKIVAGLNMWAIMTEKGTVTILNRSSDLMRRVKTGNAPWDNIVILRSCGDAFLAVDQKGKVHYDGKDDGRSEAVHWSNIIDVAIDAHCAIGLESNGEIHIAYKNTSVQRFTELEDLTDIVAIAANRFCVAAVNSNGDLVLEGNIARPENIKRLFYSMPNIRRQFLVKKS